MSPPVLPRRSVRSRVGVTAGTLRRVKAALGWIGVLALLALMAGVFFIPDEVADLPGVPGSYIVNGLDPQGVEYTGVLEVTAEPDGTLRFAWTVTGALIEGVGRIEGAVVEVDWSTVGAQRGELSTGTTRYTVEPDGRLVGVRLVDGVTGEGTEEAFPND